MVEREGYKQTELGDIPNDWIVTTFENVLDGFSSGMTPYRGNPEYYTGNIKWITSGELNYNVIYDTIEKITDEAVKKTSLKILPIGTFLMAITGLEAAGTRGSCGIVGAKATTNQSCMALYPTTKLSTDYLYQFYVKYGNYLAFNYCQGTKQQSYTAKIVKQLPIILPSSPEEQEAIAKALSDVDALIASLEQLIAKKRLIKQGTMQELLTGKRRLPGFEVKKGYKQTEIGKIPEDWEVYEIGQALHSMQLGGNYTNSEQETSSPLIKMGNLGRGKIKLDKLEFISYPIEPLDRDRLKRGDVLFNTRNTLDLVGKVAIWNNELNKAYFNSNILRMKFKSEHVSSNRYMNYTFNSSHVLQELKNIAIGTTSVAAIYGRDLTKIKIYLPDKTEQKAIATILSDMDTELEALETKLEKTKQLKEGMMNELLTGRMRLI